jgi:hypothetical protein
VKKEKKNKYVVEDEREREIARWKEEDALQQQHSNQKKSKIKNKLLQITQTGGEIGVRKLKIQETSQRHNKSKKGY